MKFCPKRHILVVSMTPCSGMSKNGIFWKMLNFSNFLWIYMRFFAIFVWKILCSSFLKSNLRAIDFVATKILDFSEMSQIILYQ